MFSGGRLSRFPAHFLRNSRECDVRHELSTEHLLLHMRKVLIDSLPVPNAYYLDNKLIFFYSRSFAFFFLQRNIPSSILTNRALNLCAEYAIYKVGF